MRAIIAVLDSFGCGSAPDAAAFGDEGANTYGHIAEACTDGRGDRQGLRQGRLHLPNLEALGLGVAGQAAAGHSLPVSVPEKIIGLHGYAAERSKGKDTPSGHWEMMGLPVEFDWGYFSQSSPSFPPELLQALAQRAGIPGFLGDCAASGTVIINELGDEHVRTGKPIAYTSADSVLQLAAHEQHFGLDRLYELCAIARELVDAYNIGRVIGRPFLGDGNGNYQRTGNRKDLATPPHAPTLLDVAKGEGRDVIGIGKIGDIFAYSGITQSIKANGNDAVFDTLLDQMPAASDGAILFANFVDTDSIYGHRRDVPGYAGALEAFDQRLPSLQSAMKSDDLLIISADHGCDPTWPGSDHTREYVPVIGWGDRFAAKDLGERSTFADIGQSLAAHLDLPPLRYGTSFL